jgi:hypothetical protein
MERRANPPESGSPVTSGIRSPVTRKWGTMAGVPQNPPPAPKHRTLKMFAAGLGVRVAGGCLIWLGDGSDKPFRKGVVVLGVVLSIGGIGLLKYLLYSGLRRKRRVIPPATA